MGDGLLSEIVEVVETNWRNANRYIEHGYHILSVCHATQVGEMNDPQQPGRVYVKKFNLYALGRTAEVEHWERPPVEPAP